MDHLNLQAATLGAQASDLDLAIDHARNYLLSRQHAEGYWVFELEADCTIPSEYIMMMHFMDEIDAELQRKIANFVRGRQNADGSWPLFTGAPGDISCTVKAYYALKMAGDDVDAPHMALARAWVLSVGGAAKANVFTRIALAMFEQIPWRGTPFIPVEIMHLPRWFPFHLDKVSYWSRTVMVPLFILCSLKVKARNPQQIHIRELFVTPPEQERGYFDYVKTPLGKAILAVERTARLFEPLFTKKMRESAIQKAFAWFEPRLNGEDGLGAIFPAMVNAYEAMDAIGIPADDPRRVTAKRAIEKLLVIQDENTVYCQPCVSPIWDTALTALAMQEVIACDDHATTKTAITHSLQWLADQQIAADAPGDWRVQCKEGEVCGGWAFQFGNSYYPDVDDSAVVAVALQQAGDPQFADTLERAGSWIAAMQSSNGGFGAFDVDNTHYYLNHIPFADHGALLDPPTADVSGRCAMFLAMLVDKQPHLQPALDRALDYLHDEQEDDGAWFGRWGTNYIYGTWSVMLAYEYAGLPKDDPRITKAVAWLKSVQRHDGGWGESNWTYHDAATRGQFEYSTAFQTAFALIALIAAGEADCAEVRAGVEYLLRTQQADGVWNDPCFTAPGFPKVFYLKYHGYDKFFPLWALAKYRKAVSAHRAA
ncbi:MAG: squalene--hopene cyclase [Methylococcaceae bacterium]|nr:MAG: squalene--hopene cyclase [Methylococcaceae bacterium]